MPHLKLKTARARVLKGHPWVFSNEVDTLLPTSYDGQAVECRDARGRFLGTGLYNSRSRIVWRRFTGDRLEMNASFLKTALKAAVARRAPDPLRRLVWSESDHLPGLVVDQYEHLLVAQALTLGMDQRKETVGEILSELLQPEDILWRNDAPVRKFEGLDSSIVTRSGETWSPRWMKMGQLEFLVDFFGGQKTGLYLDQRNEYAEVASMATGRRVLDAFCNQGGFALHCMKAGATAAVGLDSSKEALNTAAANADRNGLRAEFREVNVFDYFTENREDTWDLIVLDPPPFARSRSALDAAVRGYKEINLRAMRSLSEGGILATYSCSHHMGAALFLDLLGEAAADAGKTARVMRFCHQPTDHPVLPGMPESEYLRGFTLQVNSDR